MLKRKLRVAIIPLVLSGCGFVESIPFGDGLFAGEENLSKPISLPNNPNLLTISNVWSHSVGNGAGKKSLVFHPLLLSGAIIACSENGTIKGVTRSSGQTLWKKNIGHNISAGVAGNASVFAIGTNNGRLMVFETKTGEKIWEHQLSSEMLTPPIVADGLIVTRTIDGEVVAFKQEKRQIVWKQNIGEAEINIRGNARGINIDGTLLYTNGKGRLSLLSIKDGKPLFNAPVSRGKGNTEIERMSDLLATPVVRKGNLFLSAYRSETLALNLNSGDLMWRNPVATSLDLFADDRFVYVIDKNSIIHAINQSDGKTAWTSKALEGRRISPLSGDGKRILTVDNEGNLFVIDASNGKVLSYSKTAHTRTYTQPMRTAENQWLIYSSNGSLSMVKVGVR